MGGAGDDARTLGADLVGGAEYFLPVAAIFTIEPELDRDCACLLVGLCDTAKSHPDISGDEVWVGVAVVVCVCGEDGD